jgi:hypothetical protein
MSNTNNVASLASSGVWSVPMSAPSVLHTSVSMVKISTALVKAQRNMGNASKESKNPFFKSSYADLNSIREAVMPALLEQGVSILQPTVSVNGKNYVRTILLHESGEYMASDTEIIVAKQNDPQAAGSGISYARRYGLQSFLNVGAVDDDGEGAMARSKPATSPASASQEPVKEPKKAASFRVKKETPKESISDSSRASPGQDDLNLADSAMGWD